VPSADSSFYSIKQGKKSRLDVEIFELDEGNRITIESEINEVGVLFRLAAVFFGRGWSILKARIHSPDMNRIQDEFFIRHRSKEKKQADLKLIVSDLENLLFGGVSVLEYLMNLKVSPPPSPVGGGHVEVSFHDAVPVIQMNGQDQPGLLLKISQAFFLMDINVVQGNIETNSFGGIHNSFQADPLDRRFYIPEFCRRLEEELIVLL